jgi:hypothetical protein
VLRSVSALPRQLSKVAGTRQYVLVGGLGSVEAPTSRLEAERDCVGCQGVLLECLISVLMLHDVLGYHGRN